MRQRDAVPKLELETLRKTKKFKSKMPAKNDAKNKSKTITSVCAVKQGTPVAYPVVAESKQNVVADCQF